MALALLLFFWFIPPFILIIIGIFDFKKNRKSALIRFIIAVIYLLIGAGVCNTMINFNGFS